MPSTAPASRCGWLVWDKVVCGGVADGRPRSRTSLTALGADRSAAAPRNAAGLRHLRRSPSRSSRLSLFRGRFVAHPRAHAPRAGAPRIRAARPLRVIALDEPSPTGDPVGIYLPWRPSRLQPSRCAGSPDPARRIAGDGLDRRSATGLRAFASRRGRHGGPALRRRSSRPLIYAGAAFERDLPGRFVRAQEGCSLEVPTRRRCLCRGLLPRRRHRRRQGPPGRRDHPRPVAARRRRHIWISKNEALLEDARRDWAALGGLPLDVQPLSQWKLGTPDRAATPASSS